MNAQNTPTAESMKTTNSYYEGKVWFTKERDDYGRTVRRVKAMKDGKMLTLGVVVCVPRWTKESEEKYGVKRYFTNDYIKGEELRKAGNLGSQEHITQYDKLNDALQQWGCGKVEYERYPYEG
ncbi:hypothetical protein SALGADO_11 [Arthrobacter phage Salgado]|uniref:Uncharacterized protein n=2 Tax=Laroyevirus TaxID=1982086 RepID=A0A0U4KAA3_9CAUD|nr:hypothetical protein FDH64_gp11 [Arthrobacter phage Laroye]YP_010082620.1 hypothetical protein KMD22_gp11 [Arthrobacter phage Salgado]ALY09538.1 hypothetical protein LAROYE_11 [Arthrobacter phage Laroye]ALY10179.1 hypothetical protein SALGADO_11 [Arthrobacter phage Salgado]